MTTVSWGRIVWAEPKFFDIWESCRFSTLSLSYSSSMRNICLEESVTAPWTQLLMNRKCVLLCTAYQFAFSCYTRYTSISVYFRFFNSVADFLVLCVYGAMCSVTEWFPFKSDRWRILTYVCETLQSRRSHRKSALSSLLLLFSIPH